MHYYGLAAMMGDADARFNLGAIEQDSGNMDRVLKHYMTAVECGGDVESLKRIAGSGHTTNDEYEKALRAYHAYIAEIKSIQRDEAAADDENNIHY